ncbi:hypothetical protein KY290_015031 [Solanum tuberosum]|uniref:Retrotransposon Copia-like N-terminal domain-containing protein n=1 Tax=Solanum tuberosum TaxID=4113 RepID=A0ABQ7VRZ2_SOLTU|nr:PREDICTED: uncharacterized protein LOC107059083 [Solanum tuberosum]KAH0771050.1 hypothetical protein KY290_015031 [Solanum tuberosum]
MVEVTNLEVTKGIEIGSVLYLHPSDNPGAPLVPVVFDGIGYRSWKRGIIKSLSVKNKLGFINGDSKKPLSTDPDCKQWERCDNMVTSWILNSLNREIADSVAYVDSALELWTDLEDRYDQTNGAKLYQIQKEINDLIQGVLDVTAYYTKMKKLWEELSSLCIKNHCSCACSCGAKDVMHKAEQDRRLIQFLMGLNEVYTIIRGSILMMNPLPSVAQAFAILIQEEKQREFKSLAASSSGTSGCSLAANVSGTSKGQNFQTNYSSGSPNHRGRPFCDHCKRPGHIKEKCYQLHGYPQNNNRSQKS